MLSKKIIIQNSTGLHLRAAGVLCKEAMKFQCRITLHFKESTVNVKSVLSVLGAGIKSGSEIELICDGEDEKEALQLLTEMIKSGLGDDMYPESWTH